MAYIGVQPTDTYLSIASQQITGTGSATYTLDYSVSNEEDVAVFVNNVRQNVSTYTVSGTSLTLGGTISVSDECWVLFLGRTVGTKTPAVGSVTNDMLAGSIANAKLANSSITLNGSAVSLGGSASVSNTPAFQATRTANQTMSANTWQKVNFDSEIYDTDNAYDNSTNYRFTIPSGKGGKYSVSARVRLNDNGSNRMNGVQLAIYKNGSEYAKMQNTRITEEWNFWSTQIAVVGSFSAGDYLEIYLHQESQGATAVTLQSSINNSSFEAFKLIGA